MSTEAVGGSLLLFAVLVLGPRLQSSAGGRDVHRSRLRRRARGGSGLVTAMSVPLVAQFGPWPLLLAKTGVVVTSALAGVRRLGPRLRAGAVESRPGRTPVRRRRPER